jgi:hypothetical protein
MAHLGDHTRNGLSVRDAERMTDHLDDCAKCTIVCEEVDEVGSHLAYVMLPLLLGGIAGGTLLSQLAQPSSAMASELIPAMPQAVEAVAGGTAVAAPAIAGALSLGAAAGPGAVVGSLAVAAMLGTSIALGAAPAVVADPPVVASVVDATSPAAPAVESSSEPKPTDPDNIPADAGTVSGGEGGGGLGGTIGGVLDGLGGDGGVVDGVTDVVGDTVDDVVETVTQPVTVTVSVSGTGTPGAGVALKAAGTVYATTTVSANGTYSISAGGIPQAVGNISVVQTVDQSLLGGLIGGVLNVLKPLKISSSSGGLPVVAIG